jgi:hypothetical protein
MKEVLPNRWARLWKIHGSINWRLERGNTLTRGEKEPQGEERRVIHPSHLKYVESRKMPYLAMLDRLSSFLSSTTPVLVTCGYSFGDEHLNEVIIQGLQGNPNATVFALLYSSLDKHEKALKLAQTRGNLSLLARDAAIINTRRAKWIRVKKPNLTGESRELQQLGIEWKLEKDNDLEYHQTCFTLGDFSYFGNFLEDLIGNKRWIISDEK